MATIQENGVTAYASLGADINKTDGRPNKETEQGIVSQKLPELVLDMEDKDIIALTDKWEKKWKESPVKTNWEKQCKDNEEYWLGRQYDLPRGDKTRPMVDNLIFESVETYLPQVTRRNPEPLVEIHSSEKGEDGSTDEVKLRFAEKVKNRLGDLATDNKLRLKLKGTARHWAIFLIGIAKLGWDLDRDIPSVRVIRPKKAILDPEAFTNEDGYSGGYIGEYRKMEASLLLKIIGEEQGTEAPRKVITDVVGKDTGTELQFIEWWTPQYMCWRFKEAILLKKKNPHWNYDSVATPETSVDDYGNESIAPAGEPVKGINHFPVPKMPYEFLTVFTLGDQPMDKTSLIGQNLSSQDLINKRNKQIDKNADSMNGGMVVSLARSGLTQAQAKNVTTALAKGGTVVIPDGAPREAIDRYPAPGLPSDVFNQLADTRSRVRDIFGTKGSSAAGIQSEQTVRGKILSRGLDTDRIGGGVSEYLEQFGGNIYNWFVQLLYVYDTDFQLVPGAVPPKIVVSVKEGSLLPKDSTSIANQAIELAGMNRMSNIDLYKRLDFPNPEEMAANVWLETNAPELLYKDNPLVQQAIAQKQAAAAQAEQMKLENDMAKETMKHENDIEKEKVKAKGKAADTLLSEVPTGGE